MTRVNKKVVIVSNQYLKLKKQINRQIIRERKREF